MNFAVAAAMGAVLTPIALTGFTNSSGAAGVPPIATTDRAFGVLPPTATFDFKTVNRKTCASHDYSRAAAFRAIRCDHTANIAPVAPDHCSALSAIDYASTTLRAVDFYRCRGNSAPNNSEPANQYQDEASPHSHTPAIEYPQNLHFPLSRLFSRTVK